MVDRQTIDAKILSRMFLAGAKNLEAKERMDQRAECIPGSGWRYRYEYDNDYYVSCIRGKQSYRS